MLRFGTSNTIIRLAVTEFPSLKVKEVKEVLRGPETEIFSRTNRQTGIWTEVMVYVHKGEAFVKKIKPQDKVKYCRNIDRQVIDNEVELQNDSRRKR